MTLVTLMLLALPAAVSVTIAPDQPLPYVYIDDPLIIAFHSEQAADVDARLVLHAKHTEAPVEIELEPFHLHSNSTYWYAVHDAPRERGFYTAEVIITVGEDTYREEARFCRIDRPASLQRLPVHAHCDGFEETSPLPALRSVGLETIRCDFDNPQFEALAREAAAFDVKMIVAMALEDAAQLTDEDVALIQSHCENILRFDIACRTDEQNCTGLSDVLRQLGCPASPSIVVSDASQFEQLLRANPDLTTRHTTVLAVDWPQPREVAVFKQIAARYGQEGWQIHVVCPQWRPQTAREAARFIHTFLEYRAVGVSDVGINSAVVADDIDVQAMMSYFNGLALHFGDYRYAGSLAPDNSVRAPVFRSGSRWFVSLWSETGRATAAIPVDGAVALELTDALGNTLPLPEISNGVLTLYADAEPVFLVGAGGVLLGRAALQRVETVGAAILASDEFSEMLPQSTLELIASIREAPRGSGSRLRFLELLRTLPQIEEQWHARRLPREVAGPAIVSITELLRALCVVEEDRGEHFLEPLSDTLARAEELQSLYLTGSAGSAQARERGDWILGEVRRLIDEAEALDKADRKIEAGAVAALAEWRAHCLAPAAQAEPVRDETLQIQPLALPDLVDEDEDEDAPDAVPEDETEAVEDAEALEPVEITHVVSSGENLFLIARKHSVSIDDLLEWNNLQRNSILRIGQELVVRVAP